MNEKMLHDENRRLMTMLQIERKLTECLDNIRNAALVLIHRCQCHCSSGGQLADTINEFNGVYHELKVKQYWLKNGRTDSGRRNNGSNCGTLDASHGLDHDIVIKQEIPDGEVIPIDNPMDTDSSGGGFAFITSMLDLNTLVTADEADTHQCRQTPLNANNASQPMAGDQLSTNLYECHVCEYQTPDRQSYVKHLPTHHTIASNTTAATITSYLTPATTTTITSSSSAATTTTSESNVIRGDLRGAATTPAIDSRPGHYQCEYENCDRVFGSRANYVKHRLIHATGRPYRCPVVGCDKLFKTKNCRNVHRVTTHSTKSYPCDVNTCPKVFKTITLLNRHKSRHK